MPEKSERKRTLKSYAILGSSAFINMLISLVRVKVLAVLLGPAGVGLMGLLINVMTTASQLVGLGIGSSGTKQVGESVGRQDINRLDTVRRALFWGTMALGTLGGGTVFLLKDFIAEELFADPALANSIGWLAIGVALSIAASSQSALITGMRQIGAVAKIQVSAGVLSTVVGLAFVWFMGLEGLIFHVLAAPVASFLIGHVYVAKLPGITSGPSSLIEITKEWRALAGLGFSMMISALITSVSILIVRSLVQREAGAIELGYFQAAWGLSMMYLSFVLAVLGTDFYPKLAGIFHDKVQANKFINEQTEMALIMSAPFMFVLMGFLPWIVPLLYSSEFVSAIDILRWMIIADVIKIITFPLRFIIIVAGRGRIFILTELVAAVIFVFFVWLFLPSFGAEATGMGYLARYIIYMPVTFFLAKEISGLRWERGAFVIFFLLVFLLCALAYSSIFGRWVSAVMCLIVLMVTGGAFLFALRRGDASGFSGIAENFVPKKLGKK